MKKRMPLQLTDREVHTLEQLRSESRNQKTKCYSPDCANDSIRSHFHQAAGPLKDISVDDNVIQLESLPDYGGTNRYRFRKINIHSAKGDVLTFSGFCNTCDTQIFRPIEPACPESGIDYSDYTNQLLYSYRALLNELYKMEANLRWYKLIFASRNIRQQIAHSQFDQLEIKFTVGTREAYFIKQLFENELKKEKNFLYKVLPFLRGKRAFVFKYFKLPRIEVCSSSIYVSPVVHMIDRNQIFRDEPMYPFASSIFLNLIPQASHLHMIIGTMADRLNGYEEFERISKMTEHEIIKHISDSLLKHVETWVVSPTLHSKWTKKGFDKKILETIDKYLPPHMKYEEVNFHMFGD